MSSSDFMSLRWIFRLKRIFRNKIWLKSLHNAGLGLVSTILRKWSPTILFLSSTNRLLCSRKLGSWPLTVRHLTGWTIYYLCTLPPFPGSGGGWGILLLPSDRLCWGMFPKSSGGWVFLPRDALRAVCLVRAILLLSGIPEVWVYILTLSETKYLSNQLQHYTQVMGASVTSEFYDASKQCRLYSADNILQSVSKAENKSHMKRMLAWTWNVIMNVSCWSLSGAFYASQVLHYPLS